MGLVKGLPPKLPWWVNIRRAYLHAAAAYVGSLVQTQAVADWMLDRTPEPSIHLVDAVAALEDSAERLD